MRRSGVIIMAVGVGLASVFARAADFGPTDDAWVDTARPGETLGAPAHADAAQLRFVSEGNPMVFRSYMKFNVTGMNAGDGAELVLWTTNGSVNGFEIHAANNNTWSENTITWNNQPGFQATVIASASASPGNTLFTLDVSSAVTTDGVYSFVVIMPAGGANPDDAATFQSKDAGGLHPPILRISPAGPPPPPPPPIGDWPTTGLLWGPHLEWGLENSTVTGNPFDLAATATFVHADSGETRTTELFYDGGDVWRFRFTGTRPGLWSFATASGDADLNGASGTVTILPNPGAPGFVSHAGNRWVRTGSGRVFVPQFVMYASPDVYYNNPQKIDDDIQTFMVEHGFNGFHTVVLCRWFDLDKTTSDEITAPDPNPDPRTFRALELLIGKVYAAGGTVHIWAWGDESRRQTPIKWGINGTVDKRVQRYIAARLGPVPGWTMGYGFDLWEWVNGAQLTEWHDYMHAHFGWPHLLGARASTNQLNQLSEDLDYSSYEQHRPDYDKYVETIGARPHKPSFSEDRFRIRVPSPYPDKDYDEPMTRRGLWDSTMAGGVANIWANLVGSSDGGSAPYPHPEWSRTWADFFKDRFRNDMVRDNAITTDAVCLRTPAGRHFVFYAEAATSIAMDLSAMDGSRRTVAVDATQSYSEIPLGVLDPGVHTWTAPRASDWAIAVGDFATSPPAPSAVDDWRVF